MPGLYRSRNRGESFERLPTPPSIRALSQRDGVVYAATDNFGDGYAAGTSADEGDTWQPLLRYEQVRAIIPCLMSRCQVTCQTEVDLGLWPQEVCAATVPTMMGAAGSSGSSGTGGAGGRGGTGGPYRPSDGNCSVPSSADPVLSLAAFACVSVAFLVRSRLTSRRCRRRSSPSSSSRG